MPTPANALAVMAKAPLPGAVKTRFVPPLTEATGCGALWRAHARSVGASGFLRRRQRGTSPMPRVRPPSLDRKHARRRLLCHCFAQGEGDLGARMRQVFDELWRLGPSPCRCSSAAICRRCRWNVFDQAFARLAAADKQGSYWGRARTAVITLSVSTGPCRRFFPP
jgi:hypothetical protein